MFASSPGVPRLIPRGIRTRFELLLLIPEIEALLLPQRREAPLAIDKDTCMDKLVSAPARELERLTQGGTPQRVAVIMPMLPDLPRSTENSVHPSGLQARPGFARGGVCLSSGVDGKTIVSCQLGWAIGDGSSVLSSTMLAPEQIAVALVAALADTGVEQSGSILDIFRRPCLSCRGETTIRRHDYR